MVMQYCWAFLDGARRREHDKLGLSSKSKEIKFVAGKIESNFGFLFTGVKVNGLEVITNDYSILKENDPYNRVMFNMKALTTPDSGGVYGDGLWDLTLFGSDSETGMGRRLNAQRGAFSKYQVNKDAYPGENIDFGMVDTNFNMQGLSCSDVRYMCAELTQGARPEPPFELSPVPDRTVLKKCFRQKCDGEYNTFIN